MNNDSNILSHFFNVVKMIKKYGTFSHFFQEENVSAAVRVAHNDINV